MSFAPKHDFRSFENATSSKRLELARQATPTQKVERFGELVAIGNGAKAPKMTIREIQERWLAEKVSARLRQLAAFENADKKN